MARKGSAFGEIHPEILRLLAKRGADGQTRLHRLTGGRAHDQGIGRNLGDFDPEIEAEGHVRAEGPTRAAYSPDDAPQANLLDRGLAGPEDHALWMEIGNPHNRRLRREWERATGLPWPRDPVTNWFYDVAHKIALRDGGTNTLDNIEPLHPAEHRARHREQGDFSRWKKEDWARWRAAAAAKGATIKRGLGLIDPSVLTGIASGRIRLDSPDNFVSDFFGVPSIEDERREFEHHQRQIDPTWKPGEGWGI